MSVLDTVASRWERTKHSKKEFILRKMGVTTASSIAYYAQLTYDQLPGFLMGRLILAYTRRGFTAKEYNQGKAKLVS